MRNRLLNWAASWTSRCSAKVLPCICLLLAASLQAAEAPAPAILDFDLPAAPLDASLQRFTAQSGASVGMAGNLPDIQTRAVAGRFTALQALQRMLDGSGLEARQAGSASFRLQRLAAPPRQAAGRSSALTELEEVVVTASKRAQALLDLPLPLTVVDGDVLDAAGPLRGSRAALDFDAATSSTNFGPGRDRHFIRGVADSPFAGPSQATVSIQFDETRLNYSAPDPDLRLLDVERVEILKGPQGPLYGTGALGGVLHVVPQRPDLSLRSLRAAASLADIAHGGASPGGSLVLNLPLARDQAGVRAVAYAASEAGWIDNAGAREDANTTRLQGARLALRARAGEWMVDLHGAAQLAHTRDSQYVPGDGEPLVRSGVLPEPRDNDLYLGSLVLRGPLAGGEILFSSNYVVQEVDGTQDASASAALFAAPAPLRYLDDRVYRLFGNEVRITSGPGAPITWLAGASQLVARSHTVGSLDPAPASGATVLDLSRHTSDLAVFGEAAVPLGPLRLTAGLRAARVSDEDEQRDADGPERVASVVHTLTPSVSFDWHSPDHRRQAYLRLAQAVRPGGMNPDGDTDEPRFRSDELSSLDLGLRLMLAGDAVTLQPALFATRWRHVQSDYLLDNGLVGTHNVGDAHDVGLDTRLQVDAGAGWDIGVGALLQRARLDRAAAGAHDDLRLPIVPDFRTYLLVARDFTLGDWSTRLHARVDYSGSSRLSFEPELDRLMPHATTLAAGARLARNGFELQLTASNLLDSHADTFAFGNPFSIRATPQHTPRQPRTLTLQLARSW